MATNQDYQKNFQMKLSAKTYNLSAVGVISENCEEDPFGELD